MLPAMSSEIDVGLTVQWLREPDNHLLGIHALFTSVVEHGGAIGFLEPPSFDETLAWLHGVLADVAVGDGGLALVTDGNGAVHATGCWRRERSAVFRRVAGLHKIATHPSSRTRGLGRAVTQALIGDASVAGVEVVSLGTRGNNHVAMALYRSLGFTEWGRLPNGIAVGEERFDDVRMFLPVKPHADGAALESDEPASGGRRTRPAD
jgi:ribosomal protein S18 acetylase RimI-like enzyme